MTQRSRVTRWNDPAPTVAGQGASMGTAPRTLVRAVMQRQLPTAPMYELMQIDIVSAEFGKVVFSCMPDESAYNATGMVHGGRACTLPGCGDGRRGARHDVPGAGIQLHRHQRELSKGGDSLVQRIAHRHRHSW